MNKNYLSPYDCDMCAMIEDLTKTKISVEFHTDEIRISWEQKPIGEQTLPERQTNQAIKQAIKGRIGDRKHRFSYENGLQTVILAYDPKEYPEEIRTRLVAFDPKAGTRYCRILKEINAIQVRRDNLEELLKFTGGGTMTTPRTPDGIAVYSFPNQNGLYVDVTETWYIIREDNGEFTTRSKRDFDAEFEPKGAHIVGNYESDYLNQVRRTEYGVNLIAGERWEQIKKHGFDVQHDIKENEFGEIRLVVASILSNDPDLFGRSGWSWDWWERITKKWDSEKLTICGALIAAEIDRILYIKNTTED